MSKPTTRLDWSRVIKQTDSNFIVAGTKNRTVYLRIPIELADDSSFPFAPAAETRVKIKMFKNKLIVERA